MPTRECLSVALLTYSTTPRGSVVHTLALAEALAEAGQRVTVWALGRSGDCTFFRPVDPRVELRITPFPDIDGEEFGPRILRSTVHHLTLYQRLADGAQASM